MPLTIMDPDPDHAIFVIDLQDANKKLIIYIKKFLFITFWRYIYIILKKSQTVEIMVFLPIFARW